MIRGDSDMRAVGTIVSILVVAILALVGIQILGAIPPVDGFFSDTAEQLRGSTASALVLAVGSVGVGALIISILRGMG